MSGSQNNSIRAGGRRKHRLLRREEVSEMGNNTNSTRADPLLIQYNQPGTQIDSLTEKGKSMYVRGKKEVTAMYENAGQYDPNAPRENPYAINSANSNSFERELEIREARMKAEGMKNDNIVGYSEGLGDMVGFRQNPQGGQQTSMLAGLGKAVAKSAAFDRPKHIVSAPFATDGNLPTDPYAQSGGGRGTKDMFLENFNKSIPGYTGSRR